MILLIDNYDSFTWNLVQRLGELDRTLEPGRDLVVLRHDEITPEEAEPAIQFNATLLPEGTDCMDVYEGSVRVQATAEGYEDYEEELEIYEDTTLEIVLTESE